MDNHLLPIELTDEVLAYFRLVEAAISHIDPEAGIRYIENHDVLKIHIKPSLESYKKPIIDNLLGLHRSHKIPIKFSKSINIQKTITYEIIINHKNKPI